MPEGIERGDRTLGGGTERRPWWLRLLAGLGARAWSWRGRRRMRRGDPLGAVRAFEAALRRTPGSFRDRMRLALAHLHARELPEARRRLAEAREAHPRRYEREAATLLARGGFDLESIHRVGSVSRRLEPLVGSAVAVPRPAGARARLPFGDCRDLDEYARLSALPAIAPGEIAALDWDRLIGDLLDETP